MAKDILYIADGITVNAAWTGHIAISSNGSDWDAINITGLSTGKHSVNVSNNVATGQIKENSFIITIKRSDSEGSILKFNPAKVLNQASWNTGAANYAAGAAAAMADIVTWLAP